MSYGPLTITPAGHRFFYQLATAQAATAAYILAHTIQAGGTHRPYSNESPISQVCYTAQVEIEFNAVETLGALAKQSWPSEIHLNIRPGGPPPAKSPRLSSVQLLMSSLYEHAFIAYFENNRAGMEAKHDGVRGWPPVLTFARIVRNAFAHGGTVDIRDGATATWGNVTYSPSSNGRRVLYNDLSSGDLTLLMIEADQQF